MDENLIRKLSLVLVFVTLLFMETTGWIDEWDYEENPVEVKDYYDTAYWRVRLLSEEEIIEAEDRESALRKRREKERKAQIRSRELLTEEEKINMINKNLDQVEDDFNKYF